MAQKKKKKKNTQVSTPPKQRITVSQIVGIVFAVVIILSMVLGTVSSMF